MFSIVGLTFPDVEERAWVPPIPRTKSEPQKSGHESRYRNDLSEVDIDKFMIVARSVGTFARALDCSSSVKQTR